MAEAHMSETRRILETLKRCLRARGMTYRALAKSIGLSESSVKRLFADGSFTLARLEQVWGALEMTVADLLRMVGGTSAAREQSDSLSLEQERILVRNPTLLACFYLLLNGHSIADTQQRLKLSARAMRERGRAFFRRSQAGIADAA